MNKDIFKFKKKLNPLKYYLLFYIAIVLIVAYAEVVLIDSQIAERFIGFAIFVLSLIYLPLLAASNCRLYKFGFWRTLLEFLLCFFVLISAGFGLIGLMYFGLIEIDSFHDIWGAALSGLFYFWPITISLSIISAIIVWLVNRKISNKKESSNALE